MLFKDISKAIKFVKLEMTGNEPSILLLLNEIRARLDSIPKVDGSDPLR